MKRRQNIRCRLCTLAILMILALIAILLCACGGGNTPASTEPVTSGATTDATDPTQDATEPENRPEEATVTDTETNQPAEVPTETEPETVTEAATELQLWTPDTGVFNEGKVDYEPVYDQDGTVISVSVTPVGDNTLGLDITDKEDLISICYSVWFDAILGTGTDPVETWYNVTEVEQGLQDWGPVYAFHYWAKPAQGYYRSSDKTAIRNNMTMLYEAGVDFIILDLTNAGDGYLGGNRSAWMSYIQIPLDAMCETILEMRAEGKGTPYMVFWVGSSEGPLYQELYDRYLCHEDWKDCFVYWEGKPFLLTTHTYPEDFPLPELYTVRRMWGLQRDTSVNGWNYLNVYNYGLVTPDAEGKPEQVSVATASQETQMSNTSNAHPRNNGIFWYCQWTWAFEVHPKVVTLCWWNEWVAQRYPDGNGGYVFYDEYNQNYSRDIEPMEGGHGDAYYQWLKQYVAYYKSGLPCPVLVKEGYESRVDRYYRMYMDAATSKLGG